MELYFVKISMRISYTLFFHFYKQTFLTWKGCHRNVTTHDVRSKWMSSTLSELRTASITLTLTTIRGVMVGQLQHLVPQIFLEPSKDSTLFRCSESFVQKFLKHSLGWSLWCSTCAGGKILENVLEILKKAFLRMAYTIKDEEIPSALIVNSDQTQVTLAQGCHMTYAPIGLRQVVTAGSEEKRVITVMVSSSNNGTLLPFQAIYKGSTQTSLPSKIVFSSPVKSSFFLSKWGNWQPQQV